MSLQSFMEVKGTDLYTCFVSYPPCFFQHNTFSLSPRAATLGWSTHILQVFAQFFSIQWENFLSSLPRSWWSSSSHSACHSSSSLSSTLHLCWHLPHLSERSWQFSSSPITSSPVATGSSELGIAGHFSCFSRVRRRVRRRDDIDDSRDDEQPMQKIEPRGRQWTSSPYS